MALILLDAGLVGLLIVEANGRNATRDEESQAFRAWYEATAGTTHEFAITDLTRYEVLRGLLAVEASAKLRRLEELRQATIGVHVAPENWDLAADLWAKSRRQGKPTADPKSLDGDAILAAVAVFLSRSEETVIVATTNVRHLLNLGTDARDWRDIRD